MTVALDVLEAIRTRLIAIQSANGYWSDAGNNVYLGRIMLDEKNTPGLSVVENESAFTAHLIGTRVQETGDYEIQGVIAADEANPLRAGHHLVADIKQAIMQSPEGAEFERFAGIDASVDYASRQVFQRQPGENYCHVIVTFTVAHWEQYGNPEVSA